MQHCIYYLRIYLLNKHLSPFLFSLYLNDLQTFLATENIEGIESVTKVLEKDINVYLKLFVLLYADDTVLLAETADDLHDQLGNLKLMQPRPKF